jgi:phage baseplate assembly protein W
MAISDDIKQPAMNDTTKNWQVSLTDSTKMVKDLEDIVQCVYTIITTVKGSDPLRPDFGSDLYLYFDRPLNESQPAMIYSIISAVTAWEKRIKITNVRLLIAEPDKRNIEIEAVLTDSTQLTITLNI